MMRSTILLALSCFLALSAAYQITYTGYTDNKCSEVDPVVTGHIFFDVCALEYVRDHSSGNITFINAEYLTSCDYSDTACTVQTVCENYNNSICYGSTDAEFSNKYSWVDNGMGGWNITYSSYTDKTCTTIDPKTNGILPAYTCAAEYVVTPKSGKITYINDDYLTSCDYSDDKCQTQTICENYNNSVCYGSQVVSFSNKYSWIPSPATPAPTAAPSTTGPLPTLTPVNPDPTADFKLIYTAYEDSTCSVVDSSMTGQIFPYKCAAEYRKGPQSGRITYINDRYLTSCDYSDTTCSNLVVCENYTNNLCYGSSSASFSNMYGWVLNATTGEYVITYSAFTDNMCKNVDPVHTGHIFFDTCALEYREKHQSGMITFINEAYLISCDYSDENCQQQTNCENYTNSACYGSSVTSFSNKYSWNGVPTAGPSSTTTPSATTTPSSTTTPAADGTTAGQLPTSGAFMIASGVLSLFVPSLLALF